MLNRATASVLCLIGSMGLSGFAAQPIRLHPDNPRYLQWRGKAVVLVTSAEHYGMVFNIALDYRRYLDALARDGMNYTRIFTGSHVGKEGPQPRSNARPLPGKFLPPWARSPEPGYAGGGNKFDLAQFNPEYFERLRGFVGEAGKRGIVVEMTLFSSIYDDTRWSVNPFHPSNNVNRLGVTDRLKVHTLDNGAVLAIQEAMVRKIVRELNAFDNVFYEIQNEPWSDHHAMGDFINPYLPQQHRWPNAVEITTPASVEWQSRVASWVRDEESSLPNRHLIAQNVANFRLPVRNNDLIAGVDIINFHYAYPEAVWWNYGLRRLIGLDETGFQGNSDAAYRHEAWAFILAGGGLYNNLDYSFTEGHEDGSNMAHNCPGGGGPALRGQLKVLSSFIHSVDFVSMAPDFTTVKKSLGAVTHGLSNPGRQYVFYVRGRAPAELSLELPPGRYLAQWVNTLTGAVDKEEEFAHSSGEKTLISPPFAEATALRILRQ